jgi:iron complex transport system substrate-binding protein
MANPLPQASKASPPSHIVSLNICTDELLLRLVPASRIASITWLSRNPAESNVADLAARVPVNYGLAEQIIPSAPDLVVAGTYTTRTATALLKHTNIPVAEFGITNSFADLRAQTRRMASLLGEAAQGEQLIASIDNRLDAIGPPMETNRPTALVFNPNGFTDSAGTLIDEIMTRAGLDNIASHPDFANLGFVPLEVLVDKSPDVLIVSQNRDGPSSLATDLLKHPVLVRLQPHTHIVALPSQMWTCAGPAAVDATAQLKTIADEIRSHRASQ